MPEQLKAEDNFDEVDQLGEMMLYLDAQKSAEDRPSISDNLILHD